MLAAVALLALVPFDPLATYHAPDSSPLFDPMRPVTHVSRQSFTLQYATSTATQTRIQIRQDDLPMTAFGRTDEPTWRLVEGPAGERTMHRLEVRGLQPGRRYYYRIWDPAAEPTAQERLWGAADGWRREFAVSTQAPRGRKTIIHLPVKVLLMPNVINVESAYKDPQSPAPLPSRMTEAEIDLIKREFADSARFFWVNSGMRLWVDYQFFVDDRWQRWGPEPEGADAFYRDWPASRSWPGEDFRAPGGGDFTILNVGEPLRATKEPVVEPRPYAGQIEMAWPRRWNTNSRRWEFYTSGGGTFGIDNFPRGFPARSQFLAGGDTAWLAAHEFHHALESMSAFSFANREDERIVFNHYAPRFRRAKPEGGFEEQAWTTAGRHGEHWDGMAYWDRLVTDAQWLRFYFGNTITVTDDDEDGFPDRDPRLPLDEARFGSNSTTPRTDGQMNDLHKAMLSTWVPAPLQSSWTKPRDQMILPNPRRADSSGNGIPDVRDPWPLYPYPPFILPMRAQIDGDASEWADLPVAGRLDRDRLKATFKQGHDGSGYYGLMEIEGPWQRVNATFDGEGKGIYSGEGVLGFELRRAGGQVEMRPHFGGTPGIRLEAKFPTQDRTVIEFSFPNRGDGPWFWDRGGREIGVVLKLTDNESRVYSVYEPYRPMYFRMLEAHGRAPMPPNPPQTLEDGPGVRVLLPGDPDLQGEGGWRLHDGAWRHSGPSSPLYVDGLEAREFDLLAVIEARQDGILAAFGPGMEMNAGQGYVGFVGGYGNTATRIRLFGREATDDATPMTPGRHTIQLTRRNGEVWLLVNGKPAGWSPDPDPKHMIDRLAVLGGYGGEQVVHEVRVRVSK
jgi:hypothetical protein